MNGYSNSYAIQKIISIELLNWSKIGKILNSQKTGDYDMS